MERLSGAFSNIACFMHVRLYSSNQLRQKIMLHHAPEAQSPGAMLYQGVQPPSHWSWQRTFLSLSLHASNGGLQYVASSRLAWSEGKLSKCSLSGEGTCSVVLPKWLINQSDLARILKIVSCFWPLRPLPQLTCYRVSELQSFRVSELQSYRVSEFQSPDCTLHTAMCSRG